MCARFTRRFMNSTSSSGKRNALCSLVPSASPHRTQPASGLSESSRYSPQRVNIAKVASHCAQQPPFRSMVGASTQASIAPMPAKVFPPDTRTRRNAAAPHMHWQSISTSFTA